MIYHNFQDIKLSALGMGTMRLPVIEGCDSNIDVAQTEKMVDYAMANGINYYDTAWGYHGGNSEKVIAQALRRYPRESYFLASKFPGYDLANINKVEEIFEAQLKKCEVEYFDFYLFHNVCEMNINEYLDPKYRIFDYLMRQKEAGRIRHLGFSDHSAVNVTKRFVDAYGEFMEFGMIQLNWLDWEFQNAKAKTELLNKYNIPVWVMEPLRGGKLSVLSDEYSSKLNALRPNETISSWAFRFLQSIPGVTVVLSGMSNFEQLKENIEIFGQNKPLNENELNILLGIARDMVSKITVPCTSCRYCVDHCPQELDIPMLLNLYNEHCFTEGGFIAPMALMAVPDDKKPEACLGCGACEALCPQKIKIPEAMADFVKRLKE